MANYQVQQQMTVTVSGSGESAEAATAAALAQISKQVGQPDELVFQITPQSITVTKAEKQVYTERFLWFFLPRERTNYQMTLAVDVAVKLLNLQAIPFHEQRVQAPDNMPLPKLKFKRE